VSRERRFVVGGVVLLVAVGAVVLGPDVVGAIKSALERLTELSGPVLAVTVGVLAMLETAAFAGLFVPGELAVILGGVGASEGNASPVVMCSAAVVGALVGDTLGFLWGRRLGTRVLDGWGGRLMGEERVRSTMTRIRKGGVRVVVLGRFVGVLRAVIPFASGASGLRYRTFLLGSVLGACAWGIGFTLLGFFAGSSWRKVEQLSGRASTVVAALIAVVVVVVVAAKKAVRNQEALRAWYQRQIDRPRIAAVRRRYQRQLRFLVGRFRPGPAVGLQLTVLLGVLALLGVALGVVIGQVVGSGGLVELDSDVQARLARARTDQGAELMNTVRQAISPRVALAGALVLGAGMWVVDRRPRALLMLGGCVGGAMALVEGVQEVVSRSRVIPTFDELIVSSFPARHLTVVTAGAVALLAVLLPRVPGWTWRVVGVAVAVVVVAVDCVAVLYSGRSFLSDAVGGIVLGALWATAVVTTVATAWPLPGRSRRAGSATAGQPRKKSPARADSS
jgi:membrane protein DedA with SNARE-associated domain/membrane-associated phospholipid phosphatase